RRAPVKCTTAGSDALLRSCPTWFAPNRTTLRPAIPRRARIDRQYPQGKSRGKSPDRERESAAKNMGISDVRQVIRVRHLRIDQWPVEPKPPPPRSVEGSVDTPISSARPTDAITICAIRSPRLTGNGLSP